MNDMLRKVCLLIISSLICGLPSFAQKTVQGSGFLDNWQVGVVAGVMTPTTHSAFFGNMRPTYGVELTKDLIPEFGLGAQLLTAHNCTSSSTVFDATNLMLLGHLNLSNFFLGYNGTPRTYELLAVFGAGWGHHFNNTALGEDYNFMTSKFGLDFRFLLDKKRYSWSIDVKPAIVYNMDAGHSQPTFNVNRSYLELLVGVTYRFKNFNNKRHYFTLQRAYDRTQIEALNAKVNGLKKMISEKENELEKVKRENGLLKMQLREEQSKVKK